MAIPTYCRFFDQYPLFLPTTVSFVFPKKSGKPIVAKSIPNTNGIAHLPRMNTKKEKDSYFLVTAVNQ